MAGKLGPIVGTAVRSAARWTVATVVGAGVAIGALIWKGSQPSEEQRQANQEAADRAPKIDAAEARDRAADRATEERARRNVTPGDTAATQVGRREPTDAAAVRQRIDALDQTERNRPVAVTPLQRRIGTNGEGCDVFAVSTNGSQYNILRATCKAGFTNNDFNTVVIGSDANRTNPLGAGTQTPGTATVTVGGVNVPTSIDLPINPTTLTAIQGANRIAVNQPGGTAQIPIYADGKQTLTRPPTP